MLSIDECYKILNEEAGDNGFTREEATQLRELLTQMADIVSTAYNRKEINDAGREFNREKGDPIQSRKYQRTGRDRL